MDGNAGEFFLNFACFLERVFLYMVNDTRILTQSQMHRADTGNGYRI